MAFAACVQSKQPRPLTTIQLTVKSLLRDVQELAGFIIQQACLLGPKGQRYIEVKLAADPRRKPRCSGCQQACPGYDTQPQRHWHFVPLWNLPVKLVYAPRRVECQACGVVVEHLPWSAGKSPYTKAFMLFLARWARRLSWKDTALIFAASWDAVHRSVEWVVACGLAARSLDGVSALGIDELHWGRGKQSANFLTLIYQIDHGVRRLLWIGRTRKEATLKQGFTFLEKAHAGFLQGIKVICSDMWKPYLKVIAEKTGGALNVLDPFHIAQHLNRAVDEVRRGEQGRLHRAGKETVKRGRFLLLRRGTRVLGHARARLQAVLRSLRQTSRAWELKESFRQFWRYRSERCAGDFLRAWTTRALRSRLPPLRRVARMMRSHHALLLNYFRAKRQYNSAVVEGLNNKVRVTLSRSYGHRSFEILQLVLYHNLGHLPEPESTHRFC